MIKKLMLGLIIVFIALSAFIIFMLTPMGLKFGMYVADKFLPGELKYKEISGLIVGPIKLKSVTYTNDNQIITIKKLEWQWRLSSLLHKEIYITHLKANDVTIKTLKQSQSLDWEKLSKQWKSIINNPKYHEFISNQALALQKRADEFKLPIDVKIDKAKIENIEFINADNKTLLTINSLNLQGTIKKNNLNVQLRFDMEKPYPNQTSLTITGNFSHYNIEADSQNKFFNWRLYGDGSWQHINLTIQPSNTLQGKLRGNVSIQWSPDINWRIHLNANNLNTKLLNSEWPEKLSLEVDSVGDLLYGEPRFSLQGNLSTPNIQFSTKGNYNRLLSFNWKVNINQIDKVFPDYQGSLDSSGTLQGPLNGLTTTGNLSGKSISAQGYQADNLHANWTIDLSQEKDSKINITATHLNGPNLADSQLELALQGKLNHHKITGKLSNQQATLMMNATGELVDQAWKGTLHQFSIESKNFPTWQLASPTQLTVSPQSFTLSKTCLTSKKQDYACMEGNWAENQDWQFSMSGKNINLELLSAFLYKDIRLDGKANASMTVSGKGKAISNAKWNVQSTGGKFRYFYQNKWLENDYQSIVLNGNYDGEKANILFNLQLTNKNYLNANLLLPKINFQNFSMKDQRIQGAITGQLNDLKMISGLFPNIAIPSGFLSANLKLGGTISEPSINGQIKLNQGKVEIPDYNLEITNINFNIKGDKNSLAYEGSALFGNSPLTLSGKMQLFPEFETALTIKGNNLLVMNTTEYLVYASPDLKITIKDDKIDAKGTILIPKARIAPVDLTSVVTLPSDEIVFITEEGVKKPSQWKTTFDVDVKLGDDITANAFGAKGKLVGNVKILSKPKTALLGKGKIHVKDGTFNNYGIKLTIDPRSSFEFSNTPLLNPILNLRAYKSANVVSTSTISQIQQTKYIVGIRLQGSAHDLQISFYSIPANLSQVNILSVLATGTLASGKTDSTALLFSAIGALQGSGHGGIGKAGDFIKGIQKGLGLSEFGIETQQMQDVIGTTISRQTSFVIGKQLTDRLYLRYSHGLTSTGFLNVNQFNVRYLLSRNWAIQSYSNTLGSGADILYTIQVK